MRSSVDYLQNPESFHDKDILKKRLLSITQAKKDVWDQHKENIMNKSGYYNKSQDKEEQQRNRSFNCNTDRRRSRKNSIDLSVKRVHTYNEAGYGENGIQEINSNCIGDNCGTDRQVNSKNGSRRSSVEVKRQATSHSIDNKCLRPVYIPEGQGSAHMRNLSLDDKKKYVMINTGKQDYKEIYKNPSNLGIKGGPTGPKTIQPNDSESIPNLLIKNTKKKAGIRLKKHNLLTKCDDNDLLQTQTNDLSKVIF